jgi:hypothetical protein
MYGMVLRVASSGYLSGTDFRFRGKTWSIFFQ